MHFEDLEVLVHAAPVDDGPVHRALVVVLDILDHLQAILLALALVLLAHGFGDVLRLDHRLQKLVLHQLPFQKVVVLIVEVSYVLRLWAVVDALEVVGVNANGVGQLVSFEYFEGLSQLDVDQVV